MNKVNRRQILHAGCVAATVILAPNFIDKAEAIFRRGAIAQGFNGGRTQVNLNYLQLAGDYAFTNCLKTAQTWSPGDNSDNIVEPSILDDDGYPTSIVNSGVYTVFFIPPQTAVAGTYTVDWLGQGTIECPDASSFTGSKTSATAAGGSFTFTPSTTRIQLGISAIGATRVTRLRFYYSSDNPAETYNPRFKAKIAELRPGVIRFLNWMGTNNSQMSSWWTRRATSYVWYGDAELRPSIYCGGATQTGNAYVANAPAICSATGLAWDGVLRDKTTVTIKIVNSATQSGLCSLKVGTTAAKNILDTFGSPLSVGGNSYPQGATSRSLATLVYSARLDAWVKSGGDVATSRTGLMNDVPPELMLQLCIETGTHPYYTFPFHTLDDTPTDFIPSFASYNAANQPIWMVPRFEGPNETWNQPSTPACTLTYLAIRSQAVVNGAQVPSGVFAATGYSVSSGVYPSPTGGAGTTDLTLSTGGNSFVVGSYVVLTGFRLSSWWEFFNNQAVHVIAVNVGGNPNVITIDMSPPAPEVGPSGGVVTPNTGDKHNWYGEVLSKLGQMVSSAYSANRSKYRLLCGVQTVTGTDANGTAESDARLSSASYVMRPAPSGFTATPASNWATTICLANYFNPDPDSDAAVIAWAAAYAGATLIGSISGTTFTTSQSGSFEGTIAVGMTIQGIGASGGAILPGTTIVSGSGNSWVVNKSQTITAMPMVGGMDLTAPISYAATCFTSTNPVSLPNLALKYAQWKAWAQRFGIQHMCGYEGGYSPDLLVVYSNLDRMKVASKLAPSVGTALTTTFNDMNGLSDGTFLAEFGSNYLLSANPYTINATNAIWDIATDINQSPRSPQWDAAVAFNH